MKYVACNICGSNEKEELFSVRDLYINREDATEFSLVKCRHCGLVFVDPQPSYKELSAFYGGDYFSSIKREGNAKGFYGALKRIRRKFLPRFHSRFYKWCVNDNKKDVKFLDVGCATGATAEVFIRDFPKWTFFGVEPDSEAYQIATSVKKLSVSHGFLKEANFHDDFFDIVLFHHVLEHTPDPRADIEESFRILKSGGKIIIAVPNYGSLGAKIFGKYWRHLDVPRHLFHFKQDNLVKLLTGVGFEIEGVESEASQGSLFNSALKKLGINKSFDNNLVVIGIRFMLIPISRLFDIFNVSGTIWILGVKKK